VRKKRKKRQKSPGLLSAFAKKVRKKRTKRTKSSVGTEFPAKRDDLSAYGLRIGERPVCPVSLSSGLGWPRAGVRRCGVFQIVKTAQSRDALSAPCLWVDFCSPQSRPRGAGMLRTDVIRHFDVTLPFASPKSSWRQALMLSRWLAADARAERTGAKPSRAVVARRR
jgi:hypothetical protein